jgi:hypothetical protein
LFVRTWRNSAGHDKAEPVLEAHCMVLVDEYLEMVDMRKQQRQKRLEMLAKPRQVRAAPTIDASPAIQEDRSIAPELSSN